MKVKCTAVIVSLFNLFLLPTSNSLACSNNNFINPVASLTSQPNSVFVRQSVLPDATGSYDPDGSTLIFEWDFDSNGTYVGKFERETGIDAEPQREGSWGKFFIYLQIPVFNLSSLTSVGGDSYV